jgi:hypothetical protein
MPRYDKYDPVSGGFRAVLLDDWAAADGVMIGVGLDSDGLVVPGDGNTGIAGLVILVNANGGGLAGDVADVMTGGEIVEAGLVEGTKYYADSVTGVVSSTGGAGDREVGFTVEADRLVVRLGAVV